MYKALGSNPAQKKEKEKRKTETTAKFLLLRQASQTQLKAQLYIHGANHVIRSVVQFCFLKGALQHPVRIKVADVIPSEEHPGARIVRPEFWLLHTNHMIGVRGSNLQLLLLGQRQVPKT